MGAWKTVEIASPIHASPGCIDILGMFSFFVGHKTPSAG
jgi:hypothetical protein